MHHIETVWYAELPITGQELNENAPRLMLISTKKIILHCSKEKKKDSVEF